MNPSCDDNRCPFRATDLVVMVILTVALVSLLAPALAQSRESTKQNICVNNAKQIAIALQNHHDTRKAFPLASTRFISAKPGHAGDADAAGYSWITMILPFLEENAYYDEIARSSNKFQKDPFDSAVTSKDGADGLPARDYSIEGFLCPSFVAGRQDDAPTPQDDGKANAATKRPAVSNYHALAGSHFFNKQGLGRLLPDDALDKHADGRVLPRRPFEGDGALPFPGQVGNRIQKRGIGIQSISDGTSNTLVFAETIEPEFAAWLDGQVTWLVAAWPGNPDIPSLLAPSTADTAPSLGWTDAQLPKNWVSLGRPSAKDESNAGVVYLPAARWSGGKDRKWGPSSYHGQLVTHGFADAHVKMIKDDIDKNVYLHLVTRNGREVVPREF